MQIQIAKNNKTIEMENKNTIKEKEAKKNICLVNMWSETCKSRCEVEDGYCVYEEIEFLRQCKLEDYIERNYPGENFDEKYNHYCYECFEWQENLGSNFDYDEFENYNIIQDYKDFSYYHELVKIENEKYNSILLSKSDDKNYNSVYVLNHNNSEVYVSAKYASSFIKTWQNIKSFIKGSEETNFKFLFSQYIEIRIKNGQINTSKILRDEDSDFYFYNVVFGLPNREISRIIEFNYIKNCFKKFIIDFNED